MAAKLFGVPHSLLRGKTMVPSLRADAVMSGSVKEHIQGTMSRVPSPPKPAPTVLKAPEPKFYAPVVEDPEPTTVDVDDAEPMTVDVDDPEPTTVDEPSLDAMNEPEPELKASVAMAVNLVTMELEPVEASDPAVDAEDAVSMQSFQVLSLKQLRTLCKHLALPTTGNKSVLTERAMGARLTGPLPAEFAFLSGWYTKTL
jgi:hypothetical protein